MQQVSINRGVQRIGTCAVPRWLATAVHGHDQSGQLTRPLHVSARVNVRRKPIISMFCCCLECLHNCINSATSDARPTTAVPSQAVAIHSLPTSIQQLYQCHNDGHLGVWLRQPRIQARLVCGKLCWHCSTAALWLGNCRCPDCRQTACSLSDFNKLLYIYAQASTMRRQLRVTSRATEEFSGRAAQVGYCFTPLSGMLQDT
jgi:hypothetical protein